MTGLGFVVAPPVVVEMHDKRQAAQFRICLGYGARTKDGARRPGLFMNVIVWPPSSIHILKTIKEGYVLFIEAELRAHMAGHQRLVPQLVLMRYRVIVEHDPVSTFSKADDPRAWPDVVEQQNVDLERLEHRIEEGKP